MRRGKSCSRASRRAARWRCRPGCAARNGSPAALGAPTPLPLADTLPAEAATINKPTPIFMAHGVYDPLVPLMMGAGSMTILAGLGYFVEWKQYPMQHSVCAEEIQDIGAWLRRVLG